jgi:hypothetical protein
MTGRSRQAAFALVGLTRQIFSRHHAGARLRHEALLAEHHEHAGAEGVAQRELRRFRQRLIDGGDGIAHVRVVLPQRRLVQVEGLAVAAGYGDLSGIAVHGGVLFGWAM